MKRTLFLCVACLAALFVPTSRAADEAAKKLFTVSLKVVETKDGQSRTIAEPMLIVREGEEAGFFTGGEVASIDEAAIPTGLQAKLTIREISGDRLKVALSVSNSEMTSQAKGSTDYTVVESGTRSVKTMKRGEASTFDMGGGREATLVIYAGN